jgi:ADP-ribosylglycohydrolase
MWDALDPRVMIGEELIERRQAGYDVSAVEDAVGAVLDSGSAEEIEQVYVALEQTQLRSDWPFDEPSALDEIRRALPDAPPMPPLRLSDDELRDRLLGAWLGRCIGCNLGKPVEGWSRERIRRYLDLADAYPITDYIPTLDSTPAGLELNDCWPETTRGNISSMARDDDIDYTILGLHVLESWGFEFGADHVAAEWLDHLPFTQVYTAEHVAYRNLVHRMRPPETGSHRNPYREWIGAQIRADMWGYVSPGNPVQASELAFRDASVSHTQNGIYGEMWAAALIACSFAAGDERTALELSLAYVPARSRLAAALRSVLGLHADGLAWEQARDAIEEELGSYGRVHTINNAALVAAGLLWGAGDFTKTVGLAVQGGWDTDCNGATAGSVFGALHGAGALPGHWVHPLHDVVRSSITGFDNSAISDLAERTFALATGG